jgi:hypothetical protein
VEEATGGNWWAERQGGGVLGRAMDVNERWRTDCYNIASRTNHASTHRNHHTVTPTQQEQEPERSRPARSTTDYAQSIDEFGFRRRFILEPLALAARRIFVLVRVVQIDQHRCEQQRDGTRRAGKVSSCSQNNLPSRSSE